MNRRLFLKWFATTAGVVLVSPGLIVPELVVPERLESMTSPVAYFSARERAFGNLFIHRGIYEPPVTVTFDKP